MPLFADEAVLDLDDLDAVAELYDGVVVKLAKAGGIAAAFALISACTERGLRVLLGCMVESSLGIAAGLQLAGLADYVDLDGALLLADDPFTGIAGGRRSAHGVRRRPASGCVRRLTCGRRLAEAPVAAAPPPARRSERGAALAEGADRARRPCRATASKPPESPS